MSRDSNPYMPPIVDSSARPSPAFINGESVVAECVRRTWLGRELRLSGGIDAMLRYDAAGNGERVFVDGVLVATSSIWHMTVVAPQIDFEIESGDVRVPATIQVYASWFRLFKLVKFSLFVEGQLLYAEPSQ